ncbi:MAG: T9SS type A sorting domain-containing protein [candidate division Zixibacteria bacterium]|nr:T9SS type A sorting domain-containing protein [candidate division Zixibacteria bacterium]
MMKISTIIALLALLLWGVSVSAAPGEIVELKPTVQMTTNPLEQYDEPFDILEDMIAYDTEPSVYYPGFTDVGMMWAVQFTPEQACSLKYIQIASYAGAGTVLIHVWEDDGFGFPGEDIITPFNKNLLGNPSYQRVNISPAINIGADDFHAGFEFTSAPPPYPTADNDGPTEDRSKYYFPDDDWYYVTNDLNFRAFVQYYGEDNVAPQIIHIPVDMGFTQQSSHAEAEISDDSGVDNVYLYYNSGSGYESLQMTNTSGDVYEVDMPQFMVGSSVNYYIQATDASPNGNIGYYPVGGQSDPLTFPVVAGAGIAYDDGQPEGWWVVGPDYDDNAFAVRCTPSVYPATVTMCRAYVNGVDEFRFTINEYSGGQPGDVIAGPWNTAANASGWVNFNIPDNDQVTVESGDFCVVFNWLPDTPDDPGIGGDDTDPDDRSFWRSGTWQPETQGYDFMLRAVVQYPVSVEELGGSLPTGFVLEQNYPNPFNATTNITFSIDKNSKVNLKVYNLAGQLVETLVDDTRQAGRYTVQWNAEDNSSGVYFYRLTMGDEVITKKLNLLK